MNTSTKRNSVNMLKDLEEQWMSNNFIDTLRDCANALGELLPHDHAHRKVVDQANRLLDRHDQASGCTTLPKREWQGLTDEELSAIWGEFGLALMPVRKAIASEIEAKLKEKNHD